MKKQIAFSHSRQKSTQNFGKIGFAQITAQQTQERIPNLSEFLTDQKLQNASNGKIMGMFSTNKFSSEVTNFNAKDENTLSPNEINKDVQKILQASKDYENSQSLHSYLAQQDLQRNTQNQLKHSIHSQTIETQSVGLESFYLSSNVKVLIGLNQLQFEDVDMNFNQQQNSTQCVNIDSQMQQVSLNFNGNLYKDYQFYHTFLINENNMQNIFDITLSQSLQSDAIGNYITTIMTYGQKSTGKSQLLGTLFEPLYQQLNLIQQTLQHIFDERQQDDESNFEVHLSCYEVFLETLCDLFDETNEEFQTENDVTWLPIHKYDQGQQLLKMAFLNRKQIVDENGLSFSQSHLIVNIRVTDQTSESSSKIFSFIDLVGFDEGFTDKIMNGSSFAIHNDDLLQNQDQVDDDQLQQVIRECNDNNLFSIRNLLIEIENERDSNIQDVLEETTLARVIFAKLLQSNNFFVIGTVNSQQQCFNESLNTLEFCTKFQQALMNQQQNLFPVVKESSLQYMTQEENLIATTDQSRLQNRAGLPHEITAYLDCNTKQMNMSRFYQANQNFDNRSFVQNRILSESLYARTLQKQTNRKNQSQNKKNQQVSMNSTKMIRFLDKFLHKQNYGHSEITDQNYSNMNLNSLKTRNAAERNINNKKHENPIRIQNQFLLESTCQIRPLNQNTSNGMIQQLKNSTQKQNFKGNLGAFYKQPSERSTGFATNTQITHLRKYSQDLMAAGGFSTINNQNYRDKQSQISQHLHRNRQEGQQQVIQNLPEQEDENNQIYQPQIIDKTFSELNFDQSKTLEMYNNNQNTSQNMQVFNLKNLGNFSKIVGNQNKSKYDSSFLSTFINNGMMNTNNFSKRLDTQYIQENQPPQNINICKPQQQNSTLIQDDNQEQIQMAINQFKKAKDMMALAVNQRSKSQLKCRIQNQLSQQNDYSQKSLNSNSLLEQQKYSKATQFVSSLIKESMNAVDIQLKDFTTFFIKDKQPDSCLVCKSTTQQYSMDNYLQDQYIQKKKRFFDLDKVLKDIEMKELRQQTIQSISSQPNPQVVHMKNNKSVSSRANEQISILNSKSQLKLNIPKPIKQSQWKSNIASNQFNKENNILAPNSNLLQNQQIHAQNTGIRNNYLLNSLSHSNSNSQIFTQEQNEKSNPFTKILNQQMAVTTKRE